MAYTKNSWQTGDTVTAAKLNHAEDGIEAANQNALPAVTSDDNGDVLAVVNGGWAKAAPAGASDVFLVPYTLENDETVMTLTKTWREIADAMHSGSIAVLVFDDLLDEVFIQHDMVNSVQRELVSEGPPTVYSYKVVFGVGEMATTLASSTEDGYPSVTFE